jgi:hypothetical protein
VSSDDEVSKKARRRRADRRLGKILPDTTNDESDEGWSEKDEGGTRDDELRRDVPPHHG